MIIRVNSIFFRRDGMMRIARFWRGSNIRTIELLGLYQQRFSFLFIFHSLLLHLYSEYKDSVSFSYDEKKS